MAAWELWTQVCLALRPVASPRHWAPLAWAQPVLWASLFPNLPIFSTPLASLSLRCQPAVGIQGNCSQRLPQMKETRSYPETGWGIFMWGSKNILQGFTSWKPSTPSQEKVTELWGPPIHQTNSNMLLIFTSCAVFLPSAPSTDADTEAVGMPYQADPGSHATQQGFKASDFEFPAWGWACPSTVHTTMNGCPGASPDGAWIYCIAFWGTIPRARGGDSLDSVFISKARGNAQHSRQIPEAQGKSRGHSSLEDMQAEWVFRALLTYRGIYRHSALLRELGTTGDDSSWHPHLIGSPASQILCCANRAHASSVEATVLTFPNPTAHQYD